MITSLTEEQKAAMPRYVEKWINVGINTDRLDYDRTVDIIHAVQEKLLKRAKTPVIIVDDPFEAWVGCNFAIQGTSVADLPKAIDSYFDGSNKIHLEMFSMPWLCGSFDASMFSFYDYMQTELKIDFEDSTEEYEIWKSTSELGCIFPLDNVCFVSQKPTTIKINEDRVIHCDGGPAMEYAGRGNIRIFMLNAVRVPEWLAVEKSTEIDISKLKTLTNADQKAEFIRKVGVERLLSEGKKIDTYEKYDIDWWTRSEYELWDMANLFEGVEYAPHLKMLNQTTGVWHVEGVSPTCRTLKDAITDRLGVDNINIKGIA